MNTYQLRHFLDMAVEDDTSRLVLADWLLEQEEDILSENIRKYKILGGLCIYDIAGEYIEPHWRVSYIDGSNRVLEYIIVQSTKILPIKITYYTEHTPFFIWGRDVLIGPCIWYRSEPHVNTLDGTPFYTYYFKPSAETYFYNLRDELCYSMKLLCGSILT